MMHGTTNIKFIDAQQAKLTYQYKNTKRKCRVKPLRRINAIVASCWIYFTIKHDARNHKY